MARSKALLISSQNKRLDDITKVLESVKWRIESFIEPSKALKSMQQKKYDAIFCDEKLKGATVKGFLNWHERLSPDSPFYVIGNSSLALPNVAGVISFPVEVESVPVPKGVKTEPLASFQTNFDKPDLPFSYNVKTVSLSGDSAFLHIDNILELMGMGKQSSLILLGENGDKGKIYVENGLLLHVDFMDKNHVLQLGLAALVEVLSSKDLHFEVVDFQKPKRNNLNLPVAYALTEAARLVDEHGRYKKVIEDIKKACPNVLGVAMGNNASLEPFESLGEGNTLFKEAQSILKRQKAELGQDLSAFLVVLGEKVLIVESFGEGNLLAVSALNKDRDPLYNVVRQTLKQISV